VASRKFDLGGLGALAGPQIYEYTIDGDRLTFIKPDGDTDVCSRIKAEADQYLADATGYVEDPRIVTIRADISEIENALKFYRLDNFAYRCLTRIRCVATW